MAYFIIGIIIALFFVKKDYVKAVEYTTEVKAESSSYFDITNASAFTCNTWDTCQFNIIPNNGTMQGYGIHINQNYNTVNKDYIEFSFMLSQPIYDTIQGTQSDVICTEWTQSGTVYRCSNTYHNNLIETETNQPALTTFNFMPKVVYTNNNSAFCDIQANKIICPTYHLQIATLEINFIWTYNNQNTYATFLFSKVANNLFYNNTDRAIENQTQQQAEQHNETMNYFNSTISGEVNGTGENGTITDADAESSSCGIICKLKHLIKMLSIDNIKYLVVPTEDQMNDLFNQMQTKITSKLGILGLPVTVYTRLMQIAMQYQDGTNNWCISWNAVQVPNFEDFNIIQAGQYCFSDMLQNEKINTFRNTCHMIIGGLILLSFIQYLFNCLHRILDVPVQDNYEYFTTEDVYGIDTTTGEVQSHQIKSRTTTRRPL